MAGLDKRAAARQGGVEASKVPLEQWQELLGRIHSAVDALTGERGGKLRAQLREAHEQARHLQAAAALQAQLTGVSERALLARPRPRPGQAAGVGRGAVGAKAAPEHGGPQGEALLQRVFAVTDSLSRLEAAGLAAAAGCSEGHVRAALRRSKGALQAALARAARRAEQPPGARPGGAAAGPSGVGDAAALSPPLSPAAAAPWGSPGAGGKSPLRPRGAKLRASHGIAAAAAGASRSPAAAGGAGASPQARGARERGRQLERVQAALDPASGGVAAASAAQLLAALPAVMSFVARRRCLAALRATATPAALRRLDAPRLLHVLEAWAAEAEGEGHATFLEELMQVLCHLTVSPANLRHHPLAAAVLRLARDGGRLPPSVAAAAAAAAGKLGAEAAVASGVDDRVALAVEGVASPAPAPAASKGGALRQGKVRVMDGAAAAAAAAANRLAAAEDGARRPRQEAKGGAGAVAEDEEQQRPGKRQRPDAMLQPRAAARALLADAIPRERRLAQLLGGGAAGQQGAGSKRKEREPAAAGGAAGQQQREQGQRQQPQRAPAAPAARPACAPRLLPHAQPAGGAAQPQPQRADAFVFAPPPRRHEPPIPLPPGVAAVGLAALAARSGRGGLFDAVGAYNEAARAAEASARRALDAQASRERAAWRRLVGGAPWAPGDPPRPREAGWARPPDAPREVFAQVVEPNPKTGVLEVVFPGVAAGEESWVHARRAGAAPPPPPPGATEVMPWEPVEQEWDAPAALWLAGVQLPTHLPAAPTLAGLAEHCDKRERRPPSAELQERLRRFAGQLGAWHGNLAPPQLQLGGQPVGTEAAAAAPPPPRQQLPLAPQQVAPAGFMQAPVATTPGAQHYQQQEHQHPQQHQQQQHHHHQQQQPPFSQQPQPQPPLAACQQRGPQPFPPVMVLPQLQPAARQTLSLLQPLPQTQPPPTYQQQPVQQPSPQPFQPLRPPPQQQNPGYGYQPRPQQQPAVVVVLPPQQLPQLQRPPPGGPAAAAPHPFASPVASAAAPFGQLQLQPGVALQQGQFRVVHPG